MASPLGLEWFKPSRLVSQGGGGQGLECGQRVQKWARSVFTAMKNETRPERLVALLPPLLLLVDRKDGPEPKAETSLYWLPGVSKSRALQSVTVSFGVSKERRGIKTFFPSDFN